MKTLAITTLSLALSSVGFAADSLIAGFNFGQFGGSGYPSTDGENFTAAGSIAAGFSGTSVPPADAAGVFRANNGIAGAYDPGYATWYWDGTNGSASFDTAGGVQVVVVEKGTNGVNVNTLSGGNLFAADTNGAGLTFAVAGSKWSIVANTQGYTDTTGNVGLSFAAFSPAGATVDWFLNGSAISFASSTVTASTEYSAYSVDIPAAFYGLSSASIQGVISAGANVTFDNTQINGVVAVPEPAAFAAIGGILTLGFVVSRRRKSA